MVSCFKNFWNFLGFTKEVERSFIWLDELDGKTLVGYLKFGSASFDVDY